MSQSGKIGITYRILLAAAVFSAFAGLVLNAERTAEVAGRAAAMCMEVVLPSLFPFLVMSNILTGMGYIRQAGKAFAPFMRLLFNLPGACAGPFIMGILGGYPVGAKAAIALYNEGSVSRTECERLLSFCNNTGPAFILGVVGAGVFSSARAGMALYAAHVLASVTVGIIFRFYGRKEGRSRESSIETIKNPKFSQVFIDSTVSGLAAIGNISAFVIFFSVAVDLLFSSGVLSLAADGLARIFAPFGMDENMARQLLVGCIEMTSGLTSLAGIASSFGARLSMAAFMLGWAGVSVHCQVLSFINDRGLRLWPYYAGKILQAVISAVYVRIFTKILPFPVSASAQVENIDFIAALDPVKAFACGLPICLVFMLLIFAAKYRRT